MRYAVIGRGEILVESTGADARAYIGLYSCCCLARRARFAGRM